MDLAVGVMPRIRRLAMPLGALLAGTVCRAEASRLVFNCAADNDLYRVIGLGED